MIKLRMSIGQWMPLGRILRAVVHSSKRSSGFTLIESLVAIVVISVTLVAITPPIFWATGTRVQNRRAEQALALAQGEIDRVRAEIERGGSITPSDLPASVGATNLMANYEGPAPGAFWSKMRSVRPEYNTAETVIDSQRFPAANQYLRVDTDGVEDADETRRAEFFVQVFRDTGVCDENPCSSTAVPRIFSVTVRVYSAIAKDSTEPKLKNTRASLTGTTGTKQAKDRPLAILTSEVSRSVNSKTLEQYRLR